MKSRYKQCFVLLFCLLWSQWAVATTLTDLRLANRDNGFRIVLELDQAPAKYNASTLTAPHRIVADLEQTDTTFDVNKLDLKQLPIKSVRLGKKDATTLRFIVEPNKPAVIKSFVLTDPWRLVIDTEFSIAAQPKQPPAAKKVVPAEPAVIKKNLRNVVVVIDAGHGGRDPGATGPAGTLEKNVVLAISQALAKSLQQEYGVRAVLTRNSDVFINLRQRLNIARKNNADIFVAIHADAFMNPKANGGSVYALSLRGASSEAAKWLAEKENYSELSGIALSDKDDVLRSVLIDLAQSATIDASIRLGDDILQQLGRVGRLHKKKIEQAAFMVLRSPDIPSVLVETGFISNREEEKKLRNKMHQAKVAKAIHTGIMNYFKANPIPGTLLAEGPTQEHTVRRGESLSLIAQRYNISVNELKRINNLRSDTVKIGQKLKLATGGHTAAKEHTVQRGENLSLIAQRYNVSTDALKKSNNLRNDTIRVGQKLQIP